jgi:integrase
MDTERTLESPDLFLEDGFWKMYQDSDAMHPNESAGDSRFEEGSRREPTWIGLATGPKGLTEQEAKQVAWRILLSRPQQREISLQSSMTVAEFVADQFVPGYVALMGLNGRAYYQSMLKHVLTPEEVDRMFSIETERPKARLKTVPDWPYLSQMQLGEVGPDRIERLTSAALARGYSVQTVTHIRNVVNVIFSFAKQKQCFAGRNPASLVKLPVMARRPAPDISPSEAVRLLEMMKYPEKEMTLILIFTGMSVAEICGLKWKRVNLTNEKVINADGDAIPPLTMAIKEEWIRGELGIVSNARMENRQIPQPLLPVLLQLSHRTKFRGPNDFVLVSRAGSPINQTNIRGRKLKPIGKELNMPWLSWQSIRRIHKKLQSTVGIGYRFEMKHLIQADALRGFTVQRDWHKNIEPELPY